MVDARGLNCPMPVLMTQQALKKGVDTLSVLVDNHTAVENVTRFAQSQGYQVSVREDGGDFHLQLQK